ncbi:hypothetical protein NVS55_28195 [Myxococcus stipitatus]|uniref:hypothetical protein n=1 Tax=Myxococcus stipitatus TaxID=83455 RepID=UPI0031454089
MGGIYLRMTTKELMRGPGGQTRRLHGMSPVGVIRAIPSKGLELTTMSPGVTFDATANRGNLSIPS